MIRAVVCGLLLAAGAWCVLRGLFPPRASLEHSLAEVPAAEREASPGTQLRNRWARLALRLLRLSRADPVSLRQDLAVTGTSVAEHATDRLTAGALGAVTSGAVLVIIGQTDPLLLVGALVVGFLAFSASRRPGCESGQLVVGVSSPTPSPRTSASCRCRSAGAAVSWGP